MKTKPIVLSCLAALSLTLAACDSKEPGEDAVATVNGYEITLAELNHELEQSGIQNPNDPTIRQAALQAIINRKLLAGVAEENELDRTADFILKEQRMRDVLLADAAVQSLSPQGGRSDDEAIEAFIETNLAQGQARTVYAVEALQFTMPRRAEVMDRLEASSSMEEIIRILRDAGIEARRGQVAWDSANLPTDLVRRLNALGQGEPFLMPEGNGMVAGVIRETRRLPLDPEQSRMIAEAAVAQQTMRTRVTGWLEQARHSAEIQYGEGFAPEDAASTPAARSGEAATPADQT